MKKQKIIDADKEIDIDNKGLLFYANEEPQEKLFNFLMSMDKLKNTRIVSSLIDADIINEPEIIEQICIKHFLKENKFTFSKNQEIYNCVAKKYNNVFEKKEDTEKFFEKIKQYLTTTCYQKYENDEDFFTSVLSDQYLEIKARVETNNKIKKFNELDNKIKENKEKINKNLDNIKILENYINILENNNNTLLKEVFDENNIKIEDIKNILKIKKIDDEIEELIKMKQIWKQQQDAKDIDTEQNIYYFNKIIKLLTEEKLSYIKYINSKMLDLIDINKEEINIDNQEITINIEKFKEFINNIKKQIDKKIEDKISTKKQKHEEKEKYIKSNNLLNQIILHRKNEWNFEEKIKDVIINIYKDIYVYGIENDKENNKITLHQYDNKNEINKDVTEEINNIVKKIINDITSYRQKIEKEKKENNKQIDKKTIEKEEEKIIKNIIDNIYKEKDEIYCNEYYKIVEIEKINLLKNYNDIYNQVIENQKRYDLKNY